MSDQIGVWKGCSIAAKFTHSILKEVYVVRRNSGIAAIGLVAILLLPVAAFATAPIAKDLPDIRNAINAVGSADVLLDLDDYVIDPNDRDQATSGQLPLTWGENGASTAVVAGNELEVTVPVGTTPADETVTFDVSDATDTVFLNPIRVHTATTLLGGPLVDSNVGTDAVAGAAYGWCVEGGETVGLRINQPQTQAFAGVFGVNVTVGLGQACSLSASSLLEDATTQSNPLAPLNDPVDLKGFDFDNPSSGTVGFNAADGVVDLSIDANVNGLFVSPQAAFSDWVRVTVTRKFSNGSDDSYTFAIGDFLNGQNANTLGPQAFDSTISTVAENNGFETNLTDLLGAPTSSAFNSATVGDRATMIRDTQKTNWILTTGTGDFAGNLGGTTVPGLEVTTTGKPGPSFAGATSDRALKFTFSGANQNVLMTHKGIAQSQYSAGDVVTFSLNMYVDLNYAGAASADLVNEPTSGISVIMGLATVPGGLAQNLNVLYFTADAATYTALAQRGGRTAVNAMAVANGKWTRQELSLRIPEVGQAITGGAGTGDIIDAFGVAPLLFIGSGSDRSASLPNQYLWIDNVCVTTCPSSLALAYGATGVPMVSAGFSDQFNNGADAGPGGYFATLYGGQAAAMPSALARGTSIYGSFSQGGTGSAQGVTGRNPSTVFGTATNANGFDAVNNSRAGWVETNPGANGDVAIIATGGLDTALNFPTLDDGNRSLVLGPAPTSGIGNSWTSGNLEPAGGHQGLVAIQTPFLDMRLASNASTPGLRVDDVAFGGGTGGTYAPNGITGNVGGVFGARWFTLSKAAKSEHNPGVDVTLTNADVTNGLVAIRNAPALPSADNQGIAAGVWVDDFVTGSILTFGSNQTANDILLLETAFTDEANTPAGLKTNLAADNPGNQLGVLTIQRRRDTTSAGVITTNLARAGNTFFLNTFSGAAEFPGVWSSAAVAIDEVNLYAVRDSATFYDEDLNQAALIP